MGIMSILISLLIIAAIGGAGFGGWHGALWWHNRTRDPRSEDPRDQEIRELRAALSIAQKLAADTGKEKDAVARELIGVRETLKRAEVAANNSLQKYAMTKEALNKELAEREELQEDIKHYRAEMDELETRNHELEMRLNLSEGPDLILTEEEQRFEQSRKQLAEMQTEVTKWKQHCAVLAKNARVLREKIDALKVAAPAQVVHDGVPTGPVTIGATDTSVTANTDSMKALVVPQSDVPAEEQDDLRAIRGVGEKMEQKLHLLGIFSFRSILELGPEDLERAALVIPNLDKRMKREGWPDQARALHLDKYNEVI